MFCTFFIATEHFSKIQTKKLQIIKTRHKLDPNQTTRIFVSHIFLRIILPMMFTFLKQKFYIFLSFHELEVLCSSKLLAYK